MDKPLLCLEKKFQEMSPGVDSTLLWNTKKRGWEHATRHKPDSYNSLSLDGRIDRLLIDRLEKVRIYGVLRKKGVRKIVGRARISITDIG